MKIIWQQTGDFLILNSLNQELTDYWINALNQDNKNNFHLASTDFKQSWLIDLQQHIKTIDQLLSTRLKINSFNHFVTADLLDQDVLNRLHRTWIGVLESHPKMSTLLKNIDPKNEFHWNQINKKLHYIEKDIKCVYHSLSPFWEVNNPFGTNILNFNRSQVRIQFSQKGRSTFNKWVNQDFNIDDTDTNDFLQIGGEVIINLGQEIIQDPPKNYIAFCQENNIPVVGDTLNLANFANGATDLTKIRHIFTRNIAYENNTALFEL
jgi:hypothetical protein